MTVTDHPELMLPEFARGQLFAFVNFARGHDYDDSDGELTTVLPGATTVTSIVCPSLPSGAIETHRPIVDIDLPCALVPSSTPGHFHLYIDKPMDWPAYRALLEALAVAGIVDAGYVSASINRGRTDVRLPWVRK